MRFKILDEFYFISYNKTFTVPVYFIVKNLIIKNLVYILKKE